MGGVGSGAGDVAGCGEMEDFRVGTGFDVHRLVAGRPLVLCGVKFDHPRGLLGHSDADAPAHALADALLGAAALGDIGRHFPDTDPRWKGTDSMALLARVAAMLREEGWAVGNADVTVIAEEPKIGPRAAEMRERLAAALGVDAGAVSVKAKTMEKLGPVGAGEAIAAQAVASIRRIGPGAAGPGESGTGEA